jgi:hypothetical protein
VVDADLPNIMEPLALDVTSKHQWGAVVEKVSSAGFKRVINRKLYWPLTVLSSTEA